MRQSDTRSLRVPVRRQSLATGIDFDFKETGFDTQFNLLMLWLALNSVTDQDLPTAARNAGYALGKFGDRQKFPPLHPLAEEVLRAAHPLHPRDPDVIRKKAEPLMNTAHRFLAGYRDNSQCERIQDLAMGVVDQIERIARDVLAVWITWGGLDDKLKPTNYWRDASTTAEPAKPRNQRTTTLKYAGGAVLAAAVIGFILHRLAVAPLWQVLGCTLAVLCIVAIPFRWLITRRLSPLGAEQTRLT